MNKIKNEALDERAINQNNNDSFDENAMLENLNLAISAGKSIGC